MLERHYKDVQDLEFTIERGRLWMLQTRSGKRTAQAAIKIAVDMAREGLINRDEAVLRVEPGHIDMMLHPRFDPQVMEKARVRRPVSGDGSQRLTGCGRRRGGVRCRHG